MQASVFSLTDTYIYTHIHTHMMHAGIGLEESQMARLFAPFAQLQDYAGGTGLGLYSVRKKVDVLGVYVCMYVYMYVCM